MSKLIRNAEIRKSTYVSTPHAAQHALTLYRCRPARFAAELNLSYKRKLLIYLDAKARNSYRSLFKRYRSLTLPYIYIYILVFN